MIKFLWPGEIPVYEKDDFLTGNSSGPEKDAVAGLRAEEFVCSPSYLSFSRLMAAAEHAGARDTV